jgi:hypothetical protein
MKPAAKNLLGVALLLALEVAVLGLSVHLAWRPLASNSLAPIAQFSHPTNNSTFLSLLRGDTNDDATLNLCSWLKPATISLLAWPKPQSWSKPQPVVLRWGFERPMVHQRSAPRAADDDLSAAHTSA